MKRTAFLFTIVLALLTVTGSVSAQSQPREGKVGPMAKVSGDLRVLYDNYKAYQEQGGDEGFKPNNLLLRVIDDRVVIDAVASGDARVLKSDLEALGMQKAATFGRMVSGQLPIDRIADMAVLDSLRFARPAYATTNVCSHEPGGSR